MGSAGWVEAQADTLDIQAQKETLVLQERADSLDSVRLGQVDFQDLVEQAYQDSVDFQGQEQGSARSAGSQVKAGIADTADTPAQPAHLDTAGSVELPEQAAARADTPDTVQP